MATNACGRMGTNVMGNQWATTEYSEIYGHGSHGSHGGHGM
jgi:hypothetical protein